MSTDTFRRYGHEIVDWIADYMESIEDYPPMAQVEPGEIHSQLPPAPPKNPEDMNVILNDFKRIIMPGITHWQHPSFFAYFPANTSEPSLLAEFLTAALGAQCMVWQTSPSATELEEVVMDWLRQMLRLPKQFSGVIQDTASTSTLCAILCAREKSTDFRVNKQGLSGDVQKRLIVYTSEEAHSSIEKAVKIAGLGSENIRFISTDDALSMNPGALEKANNGRQK